MNKIDTEETHNLVIEVLGSSISGEYAWLDFKLKFSGNYEHLLHDIMCLSNARHSGMRLIIYGVEDATWDLKGIDERLKTQDIYGLVNSQVWNFKPIILVDTIEFDDHLYGFIAIADSATKPHFLRKPYRNIPAGAMYTRQGDVNTPFMKGSEVRSIEDGELEHMLRERLGIDKPLLEKIETLLAQTEKWNEYIEADTINYFHEDFPEYQIRLFEDDLPDEECSENWVELHHKQNHLAQKESKYSRVERNHSMFGWGKRFGIYFHSTPIFQDGSLIRLYKLDVPYPYLKEENGRHRIETYNSSSRHYQINYFVGAILCLQSRLWVSYGQEAPTGVEFFALYNNMIEASIDETKADYTKEPILFVADR